MPASLGDIYNSIGELTSAVKYLSERIEGNETRNVAAIHEANESRAAVHRRLDDLVTRVGHVEADTSEVKRKIEAVEKVTDDVTTMRHQAQGAGTLGQWLLKFGGWLLGAVATLASLYTYLTGRPPP